MEITFTLNRKRITVRMTPKMTLLHLLRDELKLTGTKIGCEKGDCGACSVIVNGELKKSCIYPVRNLEGKEVLTIESLIDSEGKLNDLQQAFLDAGATQCGYCIPGMVMAGEALLMHNPEPTRQEIRKAIAENLCRCTGYIQIIEAIEATAQSRLEKRGQNG
jgi:carbon-monoxide dehydrogenase small subunit